MPEGKSLALLLPRLLPLLFPVNTFATEYRCQPTVKHYCDAERCTTETEGFQHAESFFYNSDGPALGACLWTNCYGGTASRFVSADGGQTTVIGQLAPEHSPDMYSPLLVSLTIDKQMNFTAMWQYQGGAVTLDQGRCTLQSP